MVVESELSKLGISVSSVQLGVVETEQDISARVLQKFKQALNVWGLELLDNKKSILIEKIKSLIIEMIHYEDGVLRVNYSRYISRKLKYEYNYLSNIFSETKGITIQQYIILHKIERVKELLLYGELSLTEIAHKLNYSSVAHLSRQFKKVTGHTPTYFKKLKNKRLANLENL
jgi:AraC-like DNA-binding protein